MEEIKVDLGERSYKILVDSGNLKDIGKTLKDYHLGKKATIITNPIVGDLYQDVVKDSLRKEGFEVAIARVPDGEEYKSLEWAAKLYDELLEHKRDRYSFILALGGGVIGDLAGFVASTYMRGIPFIQVPTSLLAQVDASIGGKVAVNHPLGKNLIGSFYQPRLVYTDLAVLKTLAHRELIAALAEVIKYGIIKNREFFDYLETNIDRVKTLNPNVLKKMVAVCTRIKSELVSLDEREEKGIRSIINYGHTIGHALEVLSEYKVYRHGEAVSIGMVAAARIARRMGILNEEGERRQIELLEKAGLPTGIKGIVPSKIIKALARDKKVKEGKIRFILATEIGKVETRDDVPPEIIKEVLQEITV
ncbi:3-dehydroquinate synthase [bacterium]|nr:3-dehydroquinate synthase [bacterium]